MTTLRDKFNLQRDKINQIIIGKQTQVDLSLCTLLSGGHLLLEDLPGVGKTTLVKLLGRVFNGQMNRIQFTNDLLPSDIIGTQIFDSKKNTFYFKQGPIFADSLLADELNRASARTQSALLQVMEEKEISIEGENYKLGQHFIVMATQNPSEQVGTNYLPESQIDRFMAKIKLGFPAKEFELDILKGEDRADMVAEYKSELSLMDLEEIKKEIKTINISDDIYDYISRLLSYSREHLQFLSLSPRAGRDLVNFTKAYCWLLGKQYPTFDEIKLIFPYICAHRLVKPQNSNYENERNLANQILEQVEIV